MNSETQSEKSETFQDLLQDPAILRAIRDEGYIQPTDIQRAGIPPIREGKDVVATAQTGTGKTATFTLPILDRLRQGKPRGVRALVLTPTRELALQVGASFRAAGKYLPLRTAVVLGGVSIHGQVAELRRRPDILVATPGRLLDLIRQGHVRLDRVEVLVLDEADRMLDMGFVQDVRTIVRATPKTRQTLLFSATLSPEIARLSSDILKNPVSVRTSRAASVAVGIEQHILFVDHANKSPLLLDILRETNAPRALVFTRTKHQADRLARRLSRSGVSADAIHSNRNQNQRQRSLDRFDRGLTRVLVATDIVARGIDVDGISHVINYEIPNDPESYVHRVGRTARAGAAGIALSFCDAEETVLLRGIEKLIRHKLTTAREHPFHSEAVRLLHAQPARPVNRRGGPPNRRPGGNVHAGRRHVRAD